ncbi:hypothetical protein ACFX10_047136 [Malus domestica]
MASVPVLSICVPGVDSTCLYSHEHNHRVGIRRRRFMNFAELVALSLGSRTQRSRVFLPRSQSQDREVSRALNATLTNFTPWSSLADELARPVYNRMT